VGFFLGFYCITKGGNFILILIKLNLIYFSQRWFAGSQKPGFFENTSLHLVEAAKNPVSLVSGWSETGFFFENTASRPLTKVKNPVSLVLRRNSRQSKLRTLDEVV